MDLILEPWPWYVAGPGIALVMGMLVYFGKSFGVSSNLRTMCTLAGAGKYSDFFKFEWRNQIWNLIFVLGAMIGGYISHNYLTASHQINLNPKTVASLAELGFTNIGAAYMPECIFGLSVLTTFKGWAYLLTGGILVGFGTRYAGGCTSGHAISGLSNLQLPSLIAVIGFFIGGLIVTYGVLPFIL